MPHDSDVNISLKQGGNEFGFFNSTLGAEIELDATYLYWLAHELKRRATHSILLLSTASTTLSNLNIGSEAMWITVSMTSNATALVANLTSAPYKGMELWIRLITNSCASGALIVSCSGVSLVNTRGSDHSRFYLYNSVASSGYAHLLCISDGCWAVIEIGPSASSGAFA